ncbi:6-phosphogluconate dehydrogenase [Burkholderia pseudomallei]|nr:6-phosphogluconate dehydrogenase [Burkholderia pseudomallei]ARL58109.1 6-phosphogluconate dehydrogenase [Burkholderia pseudomallei]ARL64291.1 6-phosphogluconate dehydrogenase [Burkholderia pseudomallei]
MFAHCSILRKKQGATHRGRAHRHKDKGNHASAPRMKDARRQLDGGSV